MRGTALEQENEEGLERRMKETMYQKGDGDLCADAKSVLKDGNFSS